MVKFFFLLLRTVQLVLVPRQWLIGFCCTMGHHAGLLSIVLDFVLLGLNIIKIIITFIILVQVRGSSFMVSFALLWFITWWQDLRPLHSQD